VQIRFHGDAPWSPKEDHIVGSLAEALRIRLREVLREDLGGAYSVGVSGGISHYPRERFALSISFGCDPQRADELIAAALAEVERVKSEGPGAAHVDKVREAQRRGRETDLERNPFWIGEIVSHEIDGLDPREILQYDELVAAVTTRCATPHGATWTRRATSRACCGPRRRPSPAPDLTGYFADRSPAGSVPSTGKMG
jgi:zinc protease